MVARTEDAIQHKVSINLVNIDKLTLFRLGFLGLFRPGVVVALVTASPVKLFPDNFFIKLKSLVVFTLIFKKVINIFSPGRQIYPPPAI